MLSGSMVTKKYYQKDFKKDARNQNDGKTSSKPSITTTHRPTLHYPYSSFYRKKSMHSLRQLSYLLDRASAIVSYSQN